MSQRSASGAHWSKGILELLKIEKVSQVSFVPDAGHSKLISLCEKAPFLKIVRLATEEEGVSLATGAW